MDGLMMEKYQNIKIVKCVRIFIARIFEDEMETKSDFDGEITTKT